LLIFPHNFTIFTSEFVFLKGSTIDTSVLTSSLIKTSDDIYSSKVIFLNDMENLFESLKAGGRNYFIEVIEGTLLLDNEILPKLIKTGEVIKLSGEFGQAKLKALKLAVLLVKERSSIISEPPIVHHDFTFESSNQVTLFDAAIGHLQSEKNNNKQCIGIISDIFRKFAVVVPDELILSAQLDAFPHGVSVGSLASVLEYYGIQVVRGIQNEGNDFSRKFPAVLCFNENTIFLKDGEKNISEYPMAGSALKIEKNEKLYLGSKSPLYSNDVLSRLPLFVKEHLQNREMKQTLISLFLVGVLVAITEFSLPRFSRKLLDIGELGRTDAVFPIIGLVSLVVIFSMMLTYLTEIWESRVVSKREMLIAQELQKFALHFSSEDSAKYPAGDIAYRLSMGTKVLSYHINLFVHLPIATGMLLFVGLELFNIGRPILFITVGAILVMAALSYWFQKKSYRFLRIKMNYDLHFQKLTTYAFNRIDVIKRMNAEDTFYNIIYSRLLRSLQYSYSAAKIGAVEFFVPH
jgi:ABC-type bacteriocin/lantibiotic exporter with double-glycine peptidase domain